jgi:hypothetical protein
MALRTGSDILAHSTGQWRNFDFFAQPRREPSENNNSPAPHTFTLSNCQRRLFFLSSGMSKVEQIKAQIDALTWQERCELNALLQDWPDDDWDRQMTSEGKLDRLMEEGAREYRAGQSRKWPGA